MNVTWAIGAAILVAGPIMALPSPKPDPAPEARHLVVDPGRLGLGDAVEIRDDKINR